MSSFLKNSAVYLISNIFNAAIPFLLLPILTRYLTPDEYGLIAMFQVLVGGLAAFIGMNTVGAAARHYYEPKALRNIIDYNVACFYILFISLIVTLILVFLFESQISLMLSIPKDWLYLAIFFSFFSFVVNFRLSQWQVRKEAMKYGVLQVGQSFFNVILTLIFIVILDMSAKGRVDAQVLATSMFSFFSIILLFKDRLLIFKLPDVKCIKSAVNFGFPLMPHIFGAFLLTSVDRVIIKNQLGLSSSGVYLLAVQFSLVLSIVFDSINKAYVPWLYESLTKNDDVLKLKIVKNTYLYFSFLLIMVFLSFYISPPILNFIVGNGYEQASEIIAWLLLGQVFGGMYLMVTNYIFYSKETKLLSLITIVTGLLNIILLYWLIPIYNLSGAAYSYCISMMLRFLFVWFLANKKVNMPWLYFIYKR